MGSRKRLSIYLMAGRDTPALAAAAVEGGADLLEIGFPFSDPLADGPVIRLAGERALAQGMRTAACLDCLREVRRLVDVPLIAMTYASLLETYGYDRFERDARTAGATSCTRESSGCASIGRSARMNPVAPAVRASRSKRS